MDYRFIFILLLTASIFCIQQVRSEDNTFPENFIFGSASSAYQIEGGWNEDGKGLTMWDIFTHEHPEKIKDTSNGNIAADSYHKFDKDLAAIKELGIQFYRFSICWARVMPYGNNSLINEPGIQYYNLIIDHLLEANVTPMITMHHYDLPEELSKTGGFLDPMFIEHFKNYADLLFDRFGDRVKHWLTFNDAFFACRASYGTDIFPPMINESGISDYKCINNLLKAHAQAYKLYKEKYSEKHNPNNGKIGIAISSGFYFSDTNDNELVNRTLEFTLGILAQPIFGQGSGGGGYPKIVIESIAKNSKEEGLPDTRLHQFNSEWMELIKGSADFLGLNYYSSRMVLPLTEHTTNISFEKDANFSTTSNPKWKNAIEDWCSVPVGLELVLRWIREKYGNIEIMITENGQPDYGELEDDNRVEFIKDHLQAVLNAIKSGVNVTGYFSWSLTDNFEWDYGYTLKFGLYSIDFTSSDRNRIQKKSAKYYKEVIRTRTLNASSREETIILLSFIIPLIVFIVGKMLKRQN